MARVQRMPSEREERGAYYAEHDLRVPSLSERLQHIEDAAAQATEFVAGYSRARLLTEEVTQAAVSLCLFIMGQAAAAVVEEHAEFARRHKSVPWTRLMALRDPLGTRRPERVWRIVQSDVPQFRRLVAACRLRHEAGSVVKPSAGPVQAHQSRRRPRGS